MPTTSRPTENKQQAPAADHSVHCPNCSTRLTELKCKLLCRKCGYYMSCADFH